MLAHTPFTNGEPSHEIQLQLLWDLLMCGQERTEGRISDDWQIIGFCFSEFNNIYKC
jgi:hypothetical protein